MSHIGVLIETDENGVRPACYGAVTAACKSGGGTVSAMVLNIDPDACRGDLEAYGVGRVIGLIGKNPDMKAEAVAAAVKHFGLSALLGISNAFGRDILARAACLLEAPLALDCTAVDLAENRVDKSHFSGKTIATLNLCGPIPVCGLRPNVIEPQKAPVRAETTVFDADIQDTGRIRVLDVPAGRKGRIDLTEAEIIITGGRPMASSENFAILEECAEVLGAAVGASRAAVDAGYAPHSMQVGQTGKTVSPKLYIGCGLSGSVQHFAGMKTAKIIVAVNTDKDAPIFGKSDYGIVGDLYEVVPVLTEVLRGQRAEDR
ncbi:MAG: electron transfer flavoprotein subunit alpha/FixB family protein [Desulfobacteraceae bacterium]|nr:MAG: electron transfer flavoprotein subunit alpha/FixB family protein [Desulfobacteraceae bacterium]